VALSFIPGNEVDAFTIEKLLHYIIVTKSVEF